ncbi:hypothetical protein BDBG_17617, partial [Blastomyces gilchristii SLH14081]
KKTYAQAAESAVSKPAVSKSAISKSAQNSEKTEKNTAHTSNMNTLQSPISETQNVHSVLKITKLVSINVKHAQKEMKYVNILCLNALIAKKNMHLAQKN